MENVKDLYQATNKILNENIGGNGLNEYIAQHFHHQNRSKFHYEQYKKDRSHPDADHHLQMHVMHKYVAQALDNLIDQLGKKKL